MSEVKSPRHPLVIGIDLDNTLVCYDELFHLAACEEGLIHPSLPRNKEKIRHAIRLLPDGESRWTRLQAIVYGPRIHAATLFEGAEDFLRHCALSRVPTRIVSHKTRFATLDGKRVDLRQSSLQWLEAKGFFSDFGFSRSDVFFESTRAEKIRRIRGRFGALSPAWQPPKEKAVSQSDPWVRRWGIIAAVCAGVTLLLFVAYLLGLGSVVSQLRSLSLGRG